jgi:hypothetical protein
MSDDTEKPATVSGGAAEKLPAGEASMQPKAVPEDVVPEDVVTPIDGEIDLARLAPQLRGLYRELLNEPIPDRFTKLLDELANKETDGK